MEAIDIYYCEAINKQVSLIPLDGKWQNPNWNRLETDLNKRELIGSLKSRDGFCFRHSWIQGPVYLLRTLSLSTHLSSLFTSYSLWMLNSFSLIVDDFPYASRKGNRKQLPSKSSLQLVIPRLRERCSLSKHLNIKSQGRIWWAFLGFLLFPKARQQSTLIDRA